MGQGIGIYEISEDKFEQLAKNPASFEESMTTDSAFFEGNFEGVLFILQKVVDNQYKEYISEVFYPNEHIGESIIDFFASLEGEYDDSLDFEDNAISYLPPKRVYFLNEILSEVNKQTFLSLYDAQELNDNGIYPEMWHNEETKHKAYNRLHIEEGFDSLRQLFNKAANNKTYLLHFLG
ncbi:DUF1877 family protein [Bernardetia sp.]|uniref:DUF1877 family protein n=1 Tax=Bernardetia sp. TaxID=1937974 RepID=UPI0025C73B22|nr:DUF1877 family protein [Bernardetia sp.]